MSKSDDQNDRDVNLEVEGERHEAESDAGSVPILNPKSDRLMRITEVAEVLGVSRGLVYRSVLLDRSFPALRLGRLLRVREGALAAWLRRSEGGGGRSGGTGRRA